MRDSTLLVPPAEQSIVGIDVNEFVEPLNPALVASVLLIQPSI